MPDELLLTVYNTTLSEEFEAAARIESGDMTIHMFNQLSGGHDGVLTISYMTHLKPSELDLLAQQTPVISSYELTGFSEAVDEYFKRTSDLKSCSPAGFLTH